MPQQPSARSTGTIAPAGQQQPRRSPERQDGSRGSARSTAELEEKIRLGRKVLKAAGVQQAEAHARRLVELREMGDADYAPATVAWQGSVAAAREQSELLRDRQQQIRTMQAELGRRTAIDQPRVVDRDTLWTRQVRRDQPEKFDSLDQHAAAARRNLAEAQRTGADDRTISGLQTAVDVTTHQVRRAELATRRGEKWEIFRQAQDLAPKILRDLKTLEQTVLAEHDAALTTALQASNTWPAPVYQAKPEPELGYAAPSPAM